jgi:DNA-binding IclR family transcriptional regulator
MIGRHRTAQDWCGLVPNVYPAIMNEAVARRFDTAKSGMQSRLDSHGPVKSAFRVIEVLEALGRSGAGRTHAQIANELRIPKSSLTNLLRTLVQRQYLTYWPTSKEFTLGPALTALVDRTRARNDLLSLIGGVLSDVTATTWETSVLWMLKGDQSEAVSVASSPRRLRYDLQVGDSSPLHATSGGRAILAHLPREMRANYLSRVALNRTTPKSVTLAVALSSEFDTIVRMQLAVVTEEVTPGIVGLARPVLDRSGNPLGAISVAIPTVRYTDALKELCAAELAHAVAVTRQRIRLDQR